MYEAKEA
jgi:hypothetical protein